MTIRMRGFALALGAALVLQPLELLAAVEIPAAVEIAGGGGGRADFLLGADQQRLDQAAVAGGEGRGQRGDVAGMGHGRDQGG